MHACGHQKSILKYFLHFSTQSSFLFDVLYTTVNDILTALLDFHKIDTLHDVSSLISNETYLSSNSTGAFEDLSGNATDGTTIPVFPQVRI
jgi:hypothetical protein